MASNFRIINIEGRVVCIGGVGTMFHQEGFPIGFSARELNNRGVELSWFHVIKELWFQYPNNDKLFNKIKAEAEDAKADGIIVDIEVLKTFIYSDFESQREMIFSYLWGDVDTAIRYFKQSVN